MKTILLIIQREYLTRVKKRSFVIMTIIGPILMAATIVVPIYLATRTEELIHVAVLDNSKPGDRGLFFQKFKDSDNFQFHYYSVDKTLPPDRPAAGGRDSVVHDLEDAKARFIQNGDDALLFIPPVDVTLTSNVLLYSESNINISLISYVRNIISKQVEGLKLRAQLEAYQKDKDQEIPVDDILRSIRTSVDIETMRIGKDGKESKSHTELNMIIGMFAGIMIYFFIFMFGAQVMRGVIEEKTNRIVEVIISSVKPFQLMMGKIIGVALVGLTQFMLWVLLTFIIVTAVTATMDTAPSPSAMAAIQQQQGVNPAVSEMMDTGENTSPDDLSIAMEALESIPFARIIGFFLFYFLVGYLLYAALFAAIGGAVDSEADIQQFMFPITIPLVLSIVMAQYIIRNPDGPPSVWLSMIPLTSPVIMMVRVPFDVPFVQAAASMLLLLLGFLGATWLAGKIYRTGILMYGKKVNYKELWKWLRYRN